MFAPKALGVVTGAFLLATMVSPRAEASPLSCPSPLQIGQTNTYTVNSTGTPRPIDCVWGDGNLGQGNDAFLDGDGTNDLGNSLFPSITEVAPDPEVFNLSWTAIGYTGSWNNALQLPINGLTFTNKTSTSTSFAINDMAAGNYDVYALAIKDGSDPKWAVFLLNPESLAGVASMTGGSFSHFALYGARLTEPELFNLPAPEPASLVLLGTGLLVTASTVRKRLKKNRS